MLFSLRKLISELYAAAQHPPGQQMPRPFGVPTKTRRSRQSDENVQRHNENGVPAKTRRSRKNDESVNQQMVKTKLQARGRPQNRRTVVAAAAAAPVAGVVAAVPPPGPVGVRVATVPGGAAGAVPVAVAGVAGNNSRADKSRGECRSMPRRSCAGGRVRRDCCRARLARVPLRGGPSADDVRPGRRHGRVGRAPTMCVAVLHCRCCAFSCANAGLCALSVLAWASEGPDQPVAARR